MNIFDIVGPVMIGPSSSHTAGACRIGNFAKSIYDKEIKNVEIIFSGSFARTYKGHGTDKAVIAGLMGFEPSDKRIKDSIEIAKENKLNIKISTYDFEGYHPNTCRIIFKENEKNVLEVTAASIGGGNILITKINKTKVSISGLYDTLIIRHLDTPGMIYQFSKLLYEENININGLTLSRIEKREEATVIIEVDDYLPDEVIKKLLSIKNVVDVKILHAIK